jgi:hypothetical protein
MDFNNYIYDYLKNQLIQFFFHALGLTTTQKSLNFPGKGVI